MRGTRRDAPRRNLSRIAPVSRSGPSVGVAEEVFWGNCRGRGVGEDFTFLNVGRGIGDRVRV